MFPAFLLQLPYREDHVYGQSGSSEATLHLWVDALSEELQSVEDDV